MGMFRSTLDIPGDQAEGFRDDRTKRVIEKEFVALAIVHVKRCDEMVTL
jgi:hypothetical protein